jgi:hypothetical protein
VLTAARAHLADTGRVAARRGGPLVIGVAIVAAVLFGPQGMTAADAVAALASSAPLRAGLFVAWVLASAPAVRPLFGTPSTLYLRSLAPPARFLPAIAVALALAQAPWVLLHARGAGPLAAAAALASAAGAHALLASGAAGLVGAAAIVVVVGLAPHDALVAVAGAAGLAAGLPAAFHAAASAPARARPAVVGPPVVALALAYLASAWRGWPAAWIRALLVIVGGAALAALLARNHGLAGWPRVRLTLGVGAPVLAIALGGVIQALHAAAGSATWLLDTLGVAGGIRGAGGALALAGSGALAGLAFGALAAGPVGGAAGAPWGAALAVALGAAARRAPGRDDVTFLLLAAVAAAFAVVAGVLP